MRNNDLRTELEYFSEDYDEEREMEPRPEPVRAAITPLRAASLRVHRRRERALPNNEGGNLPPNAHGIPSANSDGKPPYRGSFANLLQGGHVPSTFTNEDYPLPDGLKMPSHIGSYDRKGDPNNFLHLFKGAIRMHKWLMPVACHMFTYTLKDSARIW
ncbi:hypothetical protein Tco_0517341 [Tanacetum coccineum]